MSTKYQELPEIIQEHLQGLIKSTGLENTEEVQDKMAQGWLEKEICFQKEIEHQGMISIEKHGKADTRACVAFTYSGSLLFLGPISEDSRTGGYVSIGMRKDVPENKMEEKTKLAEDIELEKSIEMESGPVKKTSPIFKLAMVSFELAPANQEKMVLLTAKTLAEQFVEVNKTIAF